MNRVIVIISTLLAMASLGCNKGNQPVNNQSDADNNAVYDSTPRQTAQATPAPSRVQKAEGDMKDLLLALKRGHFGFDTDKLSEAGKEALSEAAEKLALLPKVALYVDGHTDDRGTTEYNMSLSERRAQTVVSYLERLGVESERLNIVSFGEEMLLSSGGNMVDHAQNRRVDFRIMRGDIQFVLEEGELLNDNGAPIHAEMDDNQAFDVAMAQ